ncbi:xyloglucan galactosyltransferase MUR3-like [Tasmannia lanceolata]|uniref:xyloglucan galactosyltransferase MUR3-like n=1 Tax=Tasmannia lanceolata TaxID=3420 RepID=UPI004062AAF2
MEKLNGNCRNHFYVIIFLSFIFCFLLFYFDSSTSRVNYFNMLRESQPPDQAVDELNEATLVTEPDHDPCSDRYIYVHDLPTRFNYDILKECSKISLWTDMCLYLSNLGLGPKIKNSDKIFSNRGWFATNQFAMGVIFHNKMKQYKCLTNNSSLASAIYVPFYAGLDVSRYLWGFNTSLRDSASLDLINWLAKRPEWRIMGGRDHFLVAGRITWDFRRSADEESDWGNKLLSLPQTKNMTILLVESSPWSSNDIAIPYPTYFHPSKDKEVFQWQKRMRRLKRHWLFSFAGAARPKSKDSIRSQIIDQCRASKRGKLLECNQREYKCETPSSIMKMFQSSVFCLQPQGDSYTRRSTLDSMLAGCIPVFFHPGSAYVQYTWYLPRNFTSYSVFIPENDVREGKVSIEERLSKISAKEVKAMREKVIGMIPKLIYADPRSRLETLEDAFDVSVKGVTDRVNRLRREMREGISDVGLEKQNSWKDAMMGNVEHEWDAFFTEPKHQLT